MLSSLAASLDVQNASSDISLLMSTTFSVFAISVNNAKAQLRRFVIESPGRASDYVGFTRLGKLTRRLVCAAAIVAHPE
jgi:hypothetical protein